MNILAFDVACGTSNWFECAPEGIELFLTIVASTGLVLLFVGLLWLIFEGPTRLRAWWHQPLIEKLDKQPNVRPVRR